MEKGIHEAQSDLEAARARFVLADKDHTRYAALFASEAATQRQSQEATRTYQTSQAEVRAAEARLGRALAGTKKVEAVRQAVVAAAHQAQKAEQSVQVTMTRRLEITEAERQVEVNRQQVSEERRALDVAKTSLGYTRIVAPFPGVIVHLYRHLGDHVPAGTPVLSMYNPELTYVTANLEESKLEGVAPGNPVRLDIVAFSKPFRGRVVWINKATGANFALVPRNLSSGEFTYVVQRVPVRILVEKDERWPQLRAGLSVTVSIEHGPGDPEWAKQAADAMRAWRRRSSRAGIDFMPAARLEQPPLTEVRRWTIIGTILVAAFVFSLNARGSILVSQVIIQAFGLDRYKIQWITGLEGIGGLTSLFAAHLPHEVARRASGVPPRHRLSGRGRPGRSVGANAAAALRHVDAAAVARGSWRSPV